MTHTGDGLDNFLAGELVTGITKKNEKIIGIYVQAAEKPFAFVRGRACLPGGVPVLHTEKVWRVYRKTLKHVQTNS